MRIILVGPYAPYRGGIAHFAASLRRTLMERGHDVRPVTFSRQYPALFFPGKTEFEAGAMPDEPAPRLIDSVNPASWIRTAKRIRALAPEVIAYSFWMPFFAPAYGAIARRVGPTARHIALVHNLFPHEARPGDLALTRYFLRRCDGALALSAAVASDLRRVMPSLAVRQAAHPVYDLFGVAPAREEARRMLRLPAEAPVALFFGFVRRYKGLQELFQALPAVVDALPGFRLLIAGEFYEDRDAYLRQIAVEGLGGNVEIHDKYVPAEEVGRYFAAADVVVQPYLSATQSGVVQLAFHYDRPIIVTDVGGLAEVVPDGEAGLVIPPGDSAALAEALKRFFREQLGARLTQGVRVEKSKYGWAPLADAFESLAHSEVGHVDGL